MSDIATNRASTRHRRKARFANVPGIVPGARLAFASAAGLAALPHAAPDPAAARVQPDQSNAKVAESRKNSEKPGANARKGQDETTAGLASQPRPEPPRSRPRTAEGRAGLPSSFASAFAPLAEASLPDVSIPEGAVEIALLDPAIELAPQFRSLGTGTASYYGRRFHGRRTANGERFDMNALTAAHRTLPFGSLVRVTNPASGQTVTVRINDRGPYARGRVIDVSREAAKRLGLIRPGHAPVELELVE